MKRYLAKLATLFVLFSLTFSASPARAGEGDQMSVDTYGQAYAEWVDCRGEGENEVCDMAKIEVVQMRHQERADGQRFEHITLTTACVQQQRLSGGGREQVYEFGCSSVSPESIDVDGIAWAVLSPVRVVLDSRVRCTPDGCELLPGTREVVAEASWTGYGEVRLLPGMDANTVDASGTGGAHSRMSITRVSVGRERKPV